MKRFLFKSLTIMFLIALIAGCGQAANGDNKEGTEDSEGTTITIGHVNPSDLEISHYQQFVVKFQEIVEEETNGDISVVIHPGGELGGEREMTESVELGTLDGIITSTAPLGNFASMTNVFDLPFLFKDREHAHKVLDSEVISEVEQQLEDRGLKVLAWAEGGFGSITNDVAPIKNVDDINGMKIRTMENDIQMDTFNAFGAKATPMSFTELFTALQQGVVDGQFNPLATIVPNKFYEVQSHITLTDHYYLAAPFIINNDTFNSLSPEHQKIVQEAAITAKDYEREFVAEKDQEYLETLEDSGMEIIKKEELDLESFQKATESVYEKYEDEYGDLVKEIESLE